MYKRYFRMRDPKCRPEQVEWIEMTGSEFYRFVNSPESKGRYFIDMGDVVLESSKREAQVHRAEKDHSDYLKEQEDGWSTVSLNLKVTADFDATGLCGFTPPHWAPGPG